MSSSWSSKKYYSRLVLEFRPTIAHPECEGVRWSGGRGLPRMCGKRRRSKVGSLTG
jgi:hypothetical protein